MEFLLAFLAGLAACCGAVLLPGMLNMSVIKTSLRCGPRDAVVFIAGLVTVITIQAAIGVVGANYLGLGEETIDKIKIWAIPVFVGLAAFFFYRGYQSHFGDAPAEDEEDVADVADGSLYVQGLSLAFMNLLGIPYYYALTVWLFGGGTLDPSMTAKILFVVGVTAGCFGILTAYAYGAKWIKTNARPLTANLNFILAGLITAGVATHAYHLFFSSGQ